MLMYRQINETLNCDAMKIDEFPEYILVIFLFTSSLSHLYSVRGTVTTLTGLGSGDIKQRRAAVKLTVFAFFN